MTASQGRPRILVICEEAGWNPNTGYRQRLFHMLRGLLAAGDVDWMIISDDPAATPAVPEDLPVRVISVHVENRPTWLTVARATALRMPRSIARKRWQPARALLQSIPPATYDLVWYQHPEVWRALSAALPGTPRAVDLDNLMSVLATRKAEFRTSRMRRWAQLYDAATWRRIERHAATTADAAIVCSGADKRMLGGSAVVIPNGYDLPAELPARRAQGMPPTLLFIGFFAYEPNSDAAFWFAREVLPLIQRELPSARLRLVGETGGRQDVVELAGQPGVEVVGQVADIVAELSQATVSVAPLRIGAGTRIKILEGFAAGLPVVATTVGAEGLDAIPDKHLLIADTAADFSAACVRLLTDSELAARVGTAGLALHRERFQWESIEARITAATRELTTRISFLN